jgi:hypothetical protein
MLSEHERIAAWILCSLTTIRVAEAGPRITVVKSSVEVK